jgi:hypothetical protein
VKSLKVCKAWTKIFIQMFFIKLPSCGKHGAVGSTKHWHYHSKWNQETGRTQDCITPILVKVNNIKVDWTRKEKYNLTYHSYRIRRNDFLWCQNGQVWHIDEYIANGGQGKSNNNGQRQIPLKLRNTLNYFK